MDDKHQSQHPLILAVQASRAIIEGADELFREAYRGRIRKAGQFVFVKLETSMFPLKPCPDRMKLLIEHDDEAESFNSSPYVKRYEWLQNALAANYSICRFTVVVGALILLCRFIFSFLNFFPISLAVAVTLLPPFVLGALLLLSVKMYPVAPQKKWRFFYAGASANQTCPGCEHPLTLMDALKDYENQAYVLAAKSTAIENAFAETGASPSLKHAKSLIKTAANEIAQHALWLPYACQNCNIRFCSSCTGGAELEEHVCPDCGRKLVMDKNERVPAG